MITDVGHMVNMTKFTTTDTNIPVICFHLMEIALHSDMSAMPSHVRRSNSLPFRCSCAWPAVEMAVEPSATAICPPDVAESHLRRKSKPCSCKRSMLSSCEGACDRQSVGARLRLASRCFDCVPAVSIAPSLAVELSKKVEPCLANDSCWRRQSCSTR